MRARVAARTVMFIFMTPNCSNLVAQGVAMSHRHTAYYVDH